MVAERSHPGYAHGKHCGSSIGHHQIRQLLGDDYLRLDGHGEAALIAVAAGIHRRARHRCDAHRERRSARWHTRHVRHRTIVRSRDSKGHVALGTLPRIGDHHEVRGTGDARRLGVQHCHREAALIAVAAGVHRRACHRRDANRERRSARRHTRQVRHRTVVRGRDDEGHVALGTLPNIGVHHDVRRTGDARRLGIQHRHREAALIAVAAGIHRRARHCRDAHRESRSARWRTRQIRYCAPTAGSRNREGHVALGTLPKIGIHHEVRRASDARRRKGNGIKIDGQSVCAGVGHNKVRPAIAIQIRHRKVIWRNAHGQGREQVKTTSARVCQYGQRVSVIIRTDQIRLAIAINILCRHTNWICAGPIIDFAGERAVAVIGGNG